LSTSTRLCDDGANGGKGKQQHIAKFTGQKSKKLTKREKIANRCQWRCWWCGCDLRREIGWQNSATIEHLQPKSTGGPDSVWNVVSACHRCNHLRGTTPMEEFALIAKNFTKDGRKVEDARNAAKKAKRRAQQEAAIAAKTLKIAHAPQSFWNRIAQQAMLTMVTISFVLSRF